MSEYSIITNNSCHYFEKKLARTFKNCFLVQKSPTSARKWASINHAQNQIRFFCKNNKERSKFSKSFLFHENIIIFNRVMNDFLFDVIFS